MGLGSYDDVSLSEARAAAAECRELLKQFVDPQDHRAALLAAKKTADAKAITFDQCREAYIAAHRSGWRNVKHATQWKRTLTTYATPAFGGLPVAFVDTGLVMKALDPIWNAKPETATRVRGRIEAILDWAKVRGYRDGENPVRWKGRLDHLLPKRSKVKAVEHDAALHYTEIGNFVAALREREGMAARALEFAILTAARTGEVLGARWDEIDLDAKVWIVSAARMKGNREHRVPLSSQALAVLPSGGSRGSDTHVFPGDRRDALSNMALLMLLRRMGKDDLTTHGFRSTFRDWAGDTTTFQREIVEAALSHIIGNKAEQAYRRGDALEKRRELMEAWGAYCAPNEGEVITLSSAAR
jgi:integrase